MPIKSHENTIHKDLIKPLKDECLRMKGLVEKEIGTLKDNKYIPVQLFYRVGTNNWEPNGIHIVDSLKLGC